METQKIDLNLSGVPKTLLLPLIGRAYSSKTNKDYFYDDKAIQLMESLNYDTGMLEDELTKPENMSWASNRAIYFDNQVREFLKTNPNGTIVNIGAGLETAFYRVDNGRMNWVDLDVPEVINLRQQLLPKPSRVHYLSKSLFDYSWLDDVIAIGNPIFLFAGGVFMYFKEHELKSAFKMMANKLKGAELVFDALSAQDLDSTNEVLARFNMVDAKMQWGIDFAEFKNWFPNIICLSHEQYMPPQPNHNDPHYRPVTASMTKVRFLGE